MYDIYLSILLLLMCLYCFVWSEFLVNSIELGHIFNPFCQLLTCWFRSLTFDVIIDILGCKPSILFFISAFLFFFFLWVIQTHFRIHIYIHTHIYINYNATCMHAYSKQSSGVIKILPVWVKCRNLTLYGPTFLCL